MDNDDDDGIMVYGIMVYKLATQGWMVNGVLLATIQYIEIGFKYTTQHNTTQGWFDAVLLATISKVELD